MPHKDIHGFEEAEPMEAPKGINYLLVIGIDQYTHCPRLYNAVKDAKELVQILKKRFQFEAENIIEHYDGGATKRNIYDAFRSMAKKVTANDNLVIYFSGHGEYDKLFNLGYWIPVEAEKKAVDQYVPNSEIRNILAAIKSHHTFLMVDSCFSGLLFAENAGRNISLRKERDSSRWGLTAGRNEIVDDGLQGANSPFAKSIIYQLTNADKPIGVAELCDKVLEVVSANVSQTPRGEPLKVKGHEGGQFVFHLRKDEVADWKDTIASGTLQAYQSFLTKYPDGKYNSEVKAKIKSLSAETLWQKIEQTDDTEIKALNKKLDFVNQYVDSYEDQPHYGEALNVGELLEYKKEWLQTMNSEFALRRFLGKPTPNVPGAAKIKEKAQQLLTDWNKAENDNKKAAEQERAEREKQLEEKRIAAEVRKKKQEEEKARKTLERKNKAAADRKKEKARLAAKQKKVGEKPKPIEKKITTAPSFFQKYGKFLIPLLLLPFIIWGVIELIPSSPKGVTFDTNMVPYQNQQNQLWGYKNGGLVAIVPSYSSAGSFLNGKARVVKDGQTFYINNKGKCVRDCPKEPISIGTPITVGAYNLAIDEGNKALKLKTPDVVTAKVHFEQAKKIAEDNKFDNSEAVAGLRKCAVIAKKLKKGKEEPNENIKSIAKAFQLGQKAGTFIDSRDQETYKWVRMKDGKKWMAQNLNYKMTNSWCYDNMEKNCEKYGRLYSWTAVNKACPTGWRLPSDSDWRSLAKEYGGIKKDAKDKGKAAYEALIEGGNSGFSALLGGVSFKGESFYYRGQIGRYWSSTEYNELAAFTYFFHNSSNLFQDSESKSGSFSCRCIQD